MAGKDCGIGYMRFRKKVIKEGEYQDKTAFLLMPKKLLVNAFVDANEDEFAEIRWLETATWRQRYQRAEYSLYWHDLFWIEDKNE